MGHIVVTQPKGDKHVMSSETREFWDNYNARTLPEYHVRIKEFSGENSEAEATKYALSKTPDYPPVNTKDLKKVEAKIREQAQADAQKEAQEKIDAAAKLADEKIKDQDAKMKKLEEKLAKLEADKQKK